MTFCFVEKTPGKASSYFFLFSIGQIGLSNLANTFREEKTSTSHHFTNTKPLSLTEKGSLFNILLHWSFYSSILVNALAFRLLPCPLQSSAAIFVVIKSIFHLPVLIRYSNCLSSFFFFAGITTARISLLCAYILPAQPPRRVTSMAEINCYLRTVLGNWLSCCSLYIIESPSSINTRQRSVRGVDQTPVFGQHPCVWCASPVVGSHFGQSCCQQRDSVRCASSLETPLASGSRSPGFYSFGRVGLLPGAWGDPF